MLANESRSCAVRPYLPGDEAGVVQLLQLSFPFWQHHGTLDYWQSKHRNNPLGQSLVAVAESDNEIIGCDHNVLSKVKIGEGIFRCSYGCDGAVDQDFRRRGIFTSIRRLLSVLREKQSVQFFYTDTINPIVAKVLSRVEERFPHVVQDLCWMRDVRMHFLLNPHKNAWLMMFGLGAARLLNRVRGSSRSDRRNQDLRIEKIPTFTNRIDEFWDEVSGHYSFITQRSKEWLNWRYCNMTARGLENTISQVEENGKIAGYSVLKIYRDRENYAFAEIADLLALPNRPDVADALVIDAIGYCETNGVNICNALVVKGHPYEDILKRRGFVNTRRKRHIFYLHRGIDEEIQKFMASSPSKVYFSAGDII